VWVRLIACPDKFEVGREGLEPPISAMLSLKR